MRMPSALRLIASPLQVCGTIVTLEQHTCSEVVRRVQVLAMKQTPWGKVPKVPFPLHSTGYLKGKTLAALYYSLSSARSSHFESWVLSDVTPFHQGGTELA